MKYTYKALRENQISHRNEIQCFCKHLVVKSCLQKNKEIIDILSITASSTQAISTESTLKIKIVKPVKYIFIKNNLAHSPCGHHQ